MPGGWGVGHASLFTVLGRVPIRAQPQAAGDDIAGDLAEPTVLSIGVGPQPDKGLADGDVELLGDHPGGLVDLGPVPRQIRRLAARSAAWRRGCPIGMLAFEQDNNGSIGHNQGITGLRAGIQVV